MRAASCPLPHQSHHTSGQCRCIKSCWALVSGYFRQFCSQIPDAIVSICFDYHHDIITLTHSLDATPFTILFAMYHCQKILLFDAWQLLSNRMQCEYLEDSSLCSAAQQRKVAKDLIHGLWGISDKQSSKNISKELFIVFGTFYRQNQLLSKSEHISHWSSHEIILSLLHFLIHSESDIKNEANLWEFIECLRTYFHKRMYHGMAFLNEIKSMKFTKNHCHHHQCTYSMEEKCDSHQFISYETDPFDTDNEESEENDEKQVKFAKFISNIAYHPNDDDVIIPSKPPKLAYMSHSEQYVKPKIRELMNLSVPNTNYFHKRHSMGTNVITPVPMKLLQSKSKSFHSDLMRESSLITKADNLEYIKMGNGGNIKIDCNELHGSDAQSVGKKSTRGMSDLELMEIFKEDLYDDDDDESENEQDEVCCEEEDEYSTKVGPSFSKDINFGIALIESFGYKKVSEIMKEFDLDYSANFVEDLSIALNEWVDSIYRL